MRSTTASMRRRRNFVVAVVCVSIFIVLTVRRDVPQAREAREPSDELESGMLLPPADERYAQTDTLILVPGHGVFKGLNAEKEWANEDAWGLEAFQRGHNGFLIRAFSQHIKRSLVELKARGTATSIVIFSGGQTKPYGPRSEGLSYYTIAEVNRLFGVFPDAATQDDVLQTRLFAEEFARDSYENLIFSICRYFEVVGSYPKKIVIVNWNYKRERFEDYHRVAVRWPKQAFEYIGIDMSDAAKSIGAEVPESMTKFSDAGTLKRVQGDMYLCRANAVTRAQRNPQRRVIPYLQSNPQLKRLLQYCGPDLFDEQQLPWR